MKKGLTLLMVLVFIISGASAAFAASDAESFFKGKIIQCIVPYKTGGGYDAWMRAVAPFFKKYSGASMVIRNTPGAGSLVGTNQLYVAEPNGLTIGILNGPGTMQAQLTGIRGVKFDLKKFTWLGRLTAEQRLVYMGTKSNYKTIEEMLKATAPIKMGAPGLGSSNYYEIILIAEATGMPVDMITGYDTANEVTLAIIRGELEGASGSYSSVIDTVQNGDTIVVAQYGDLSMPDLVKVPHVSKLPITAKDGKALIDIVYALNDVGRSVVAPPGVAADRAAFLEDALKKTLEDPGFLDIAKKQQMEVVHLSSDRIKKVVANGLDITPEMNARLKEIASKYQKR